MEEQEESSFSQHSHSPTSATSGAEQPASNLKRFHGATGLLEFVQRRRSSHDNHEEPYMEADDARFFDSRDYRCCCSIFHAKIGTFVFCTWIFHEIVLGTIYLLTQLENGGELTSRMALLLACRLIQLPAIALLYVGLWRHQRYLLLPFALVQITLGTFVDMSTLMMLVEHLDASGSSLVPFFQDHNTRWLNVVVPLLLYTTIQVGLMWVLYKCFVFLKARSAHDEKRRLEKQKEQTKLQIMSTSCNHPLIQRSLSDREPPALTNHRRDSTAPKASTSPPEATSFRVNEGPEDRPSAPPSRNSSPHALVLISSQNAPYRESLP